MKALFALVVFSVFSSFAFALEVGSTLPEITLENQFAETIKVNPETKWVVFVAGKDISKSVTDYLVESKFNLEASQIIYVSDISGMPSFITKMVALPKMQKYGFKMALDKSGDITKSWPRQEGKATAMGLDNLKVTKIQFLGSNEDISKFFTEAKLVK